MKKIFHYLFQFLGGIYLAIVLLAISATAVVVGTIIESRTGSHLWAAQWTYQHPFFLLILSLFFINILFSAIRRWPFKKKHIPFLMTHLGLLMIIGGTMIKNQWGLQGVLFVWEGSGSQDVQLPHTYSLSLETKNNSHSPFKQHFINLDSFRPNIYFPNQDPYLKIKLIGYAPHVKVIMESWIKDSKAYLSGFPPILVQSWDNSQPFPNIQLYQNKFLPQSSPWSILVLQTLQTEQAVHEAYLKGLTLQLKAKDDSQELLEIPLKSILSEPVLFHKGHLSAQLHIHSDSIMDGGDIPSLTINWKSSETNLVEVLTIQLKGQDALRVKSDPRFWLTSSFQVDLVRSHPSLLLIDNEQEAILLYAFDRHGRVHSECFNSAHPQNVISYDQGFGGYGLQIIIPFPEFITSRTIKEKAWSFQLSKELDQLLARQPSICPPLHLFRKACEEAKVNFSQTLLEFLNDWNDCPNFLFKSHDNLSVSLKQALEKINYNELATDDLKACQWTALIFDQLEHSVKKGEYPLKVLERNHWPFIDELRQRIEQEGNESPLNLLSQQIASVVNYLPPHLNSFPDTVSNKAVFLSALLRIYGIDYGSFFPYQQSEKEDFSSIEKYWKEISDDFQGQKEMMLETLLRQRLIPENPPLKLEDYRPGIILEVQKGGQKQKVCLAYDVTGSGLKWPILNGKYLLRFQPQYKEIPYRIRLRQAKQIPYPQSSQIYSYESDLLISEKNKEPTPHTLSMNYVHETWDGYRFYLSGVSTTPESRIKRIQIAVNHDPGKYLLTYPGAGLVFAGTFLLFWLFPNRKS